ncbi:hypothetical protein EVAR_88098_1 [Eumeta japonica]|uniref:Uncharacterized protein n=1 Tax=Eumeta variegata TaxID=151549 RepID=A0A4C1WIB7_EUMVA|nr:hypothetical protein EVAR_88098_1 [Eumeta japonica]
MMIVIEICGSLFDIQCTANVSESAADILSRRPADMSITAMPEDRKTVVVFPRSDKKFMVQSHIETGATDRSKKSELSEMNIGGQTSRRYLQKSIIITNGKHFTVEQTTRGSIRLRQPKRSRLMKKFDEILRSKKTEKDRNELGSDNRKEIKDTKDILSGESSSATIQLHELDNPVAISDMDGAGAKRRARQSENENLRYSVDDTKSAADVDGGEREDRQEFLFIDGDAGEEFADGPVRINLLDGITGQLSNFYEETESVTEIELNDSEENRKKRMFQDALESSGLFEDFKYECSPPDSKILAFVCDFAQDVAKTEPVAISKSELEIKSEIGLESKVESNSGSRLTAWSVNTKKRKNFSTSTRAEQLATTS